MPRTRKSLPQSDDDLKVGKGHEPFVPILGLSLCPACIKKNGKWVCPQNKKQCLYKTGGGKVEVWSKNANKNGNATSVAVDKRKRRKRKQRGSLRVQALRYAVYRRKTLCGELRT